MLDIPALIKSLENCPCGRSHQIHISRVEIRPGVLAETGRILKEELGGEHLHVVYDDNTVRAAGGILDILREAGYRLTETHYENLKEATMREVEEVKRDAEGADAVLSIGTGSLNDICRYGCYQTGQPFAIFATAPSMDGFLSQQAPILTDGFKITYNAKAPSVLIADVNILAKAPTELKAAGLGDLIGKYTALADWKVAAMTTGEYYCDAIAANMKKAVDEAVRLAKSGLGDTEDPDYAASLMEALALSGLMIYLSGCTRPASGAEHHLSHFWEMQYVARGLPPVYHGKKVGIAAGIVADIYHKIAQYDDFDCAKREMTEEELRPVFGPLYEMLMKENTPDPIDAVDPSVLKSHWKEIQRVVREEVPTGEEIRAILRQAGGEATPEEAGIPADLACYAPRYGHYARFRMTLLRITNTLIVHGEEIYA